MMIRNRSGRLSAIVLLAVFVQALLLASFHRHQPVPPHNSVCEISEGHSSHYIFINHDGIDDCRICRFISAVQLEITPTAQPVISVVQGVDCPAVPVSLQAGYQERSKSRAPPVVSC